MQSQYPWNLARPGIEASLSNAPAASSISLNDCALPGSVEVPKTATRESLGTISFKSSSCFPLSSGASVDNPVMFPPGRARLATNPFPTGSAILRHDNGNRTRRFLGGTGCCRASRDDDVYLETHQFGRKAREPIELALGKSPFNGNVFALDVAKLAQTLRNASMRAGMLERSEQLGILSGGIFVGCCA